MKNRDERPLRLDGHTIHEATVKLCLKPHSQTAVFYLDVMNSDVEARTVETASPVQTEHEAVQGTLERSAYYFSLGHIRILMRTPTIHCDIAVAVTKDEEILAVNINGSELVKGS